MSAQPIHQEPDPRDPQVILERLPEAERPGFLREYREALSVAREDLSKYKDLQKVLIHWQLTVEALNDPAYHQALAEARSATTPGLTLDQVAAMRRAG